MGQTIAQRQLKVLESAHRAIVEQAKKDGVSITRLHDGSYEAATMHDGQRVHQRYFDYKPWMVAMEFSNYLRKLGADTRSKA
jgi:hypothetical protein